MEIQIVACVAENNVIGYNGEMPWKEIRIDFKRFRKITAAGIVIMGMGTYKSIGMTPLDGRENIVITSDNSLVTSNKVLPVNSFSTAIDFATTHFNNHPDIITGVFVIGGQSVYEQAMPYASRMHLTELFEEYPGDRFFPEFDATEWEMVNEEYASENGREMRFVEYARRNF